MSHTSHTMNSRGFSLIEVIVYIAVTILVAGAGVTTYLTLTTIIVRNATEAAVNHSAIVALEQISRDIKKSATVSTGQSTLGVDASVLTLDRGTSTARYQIESGRIMYRENGTDVGYLTNDDVTVKSFVVNHFVGTSTELVRVALMLEGISKAASTTRTYYTSGVLRGSYE